METLLLCNAKTLWVPEGSERGERQMQNMHISLKENQEDAGKKDIPIGRHNQYSLLCHTTGYMTVSLHCIKGLLISSRFELFTAF